MLDGGSAYHSEPTLYKIEGCIHFSPNENTLQNVINGQTVTLLSTASDCFKILIEAQGRVVSREEIKDLVWGRRGVVVSNNTFYQNMLHLRRGLEKVGLGNRIISTHYGKGVTIDNGFEIISINALPETNRSEPETAKDSVTYSNSFQTGVDTLSKSNTFGRKKSNKRLVIIINIILFLCITIMLYISYSFERDNYFSQYKKTNLRVKNCDVYTDPTLISENELQELLIQNTLICEAGENIYISSVYPIRRMSVIRCTGNFLRGEECESDYYLE